MSENKKAEQSAYEQQESRLSAQSAAFIKLLTQRGILGDADIDDDKIRQVQKDKKRRTYHNTEMLLQNYRSIVWALECFPTTIVRLYRCLPAAACQWRTIHRHLIPPNPNNQCCGLEVMRYIRLDF